MTKADRISVVFWFGIGPVVGICHLLCETFGLASAWFYSGKTRITDTVDNKQPSAARSKKACPLIPVLADADDRCDFTIPFLT